MATLYRFAGICLAVLFVFLLTTSFAFASGGRILFSTTWDDNYLYAGFIVDDQNVVGVNKAPDSKPWEDDSVDLYFDVNNARKRFLSQDNYRMVVSAAGGSSFAVGGAGGWQTKQIFTYKYGTTVQGTINNPEDVDRSFSVEVALPWSEIGVTPEVGKTIGFNLLRIMKGEADAFVSLAPGVTSAEDTHDPSLWVSLVLAGTGAVQESENGKIVSPKVGETTPLINGLLQAREWRSAAVIEIEQPQIAQLQGDDIDDESADRKKSKDHAHPNETLIFGRYFYWYGASSPALTNQPVRGVGPWMNYGRVQWHKDELQGMRKSGIDAVLPAYSGDAESRKVYADKGLDCLAQALIELKNEGKEYPLVALSLDLASLSAAYKGEKPNLLDPEVQRTLYGMISNFYSRVPEEFLLVSQLDSKRGRARANVIFLYGSENLGDVDSTFIQYCDKRFAQEFDAALIWIGDQGLKEKAPEMDGYVSFGAGLGLSFDDTGWLDIAAIGPGFDDSANSAQARVRLRDETKAYQDDWTEIITRKPDWIVIDTWNGFHEGSEICPSVQYGATYAELTAVQAIRFRGMRELDSAFVRHNIPQVIVPQAIHMAEITVKNVGTTPWRVGDQHSLSYRWFRNGRLYDEGAVRVPLLRNVLPGRTSNLMIGILAQDSHGQPIPPGQYELRFGMVQGQENWFTNSGDAALVVPVRVGLPTGPKARFMSSSLPAMMKAGASYPFKARIRNDGATAWKGGGSVEALCRLYKVSKYTYDAPEEIIEVIDLQPVKMSIPTTIDPGRILELSGTLTLVDKSGNPLPICRQDDLWTYKLRWVLWSDRRWLGESDGSPWHQSITILDNDCATEFVSCQAPLEMQVGKTVTAPVALKNNGPEPIRGAKVGYHWYDADGKLVAVESLKTPLKTLAPGEVAVVQAKVHAPSSEGQYHLVMDLFHNEAWVSTLSNSRDSDTIISPVTVVQTLKKRK